MTGNLEDLWRWNGSHPFRAYNLWARSYVHVLGPEKIGPRFRAIDETTGMVVALACDVSIYRFIEHVEPLPIIPAIE